MAETQSITPAQRAAYFNQLTRLHERTLPPESFVEGGIKTIDIPKTRLLAKITLQVEATVNVKHATETAYVPAAFDPWRLLKQVKVSLNNGFEPYRLDYKGLYLYNLLRHNASVLTSAASGRGKVVQGLTASSSGTDNTIKFFVDLPIMLNERDPIGLILLQNEQTGVSLEISAIDDIDTLLSVTTGFTTVLSAMKVTPIISTFSIPAVQNAFPDITLLKLVQSSEQSIAAAGEITVKFPVGNTYRRIACFIEGSDGAGVLDSELTSNFELSFNQADVPVSVTPEYVAQRNHEFYGTTLANGIYVFDFTYQGLEGYGGARDYIDTEKLTEFWLKFQAAETGKITYVRETLARLQS